MSDTASKFAGKTAAAKERQVRLNVVRVSPWSALKVSLLIGVAGAILTVVVLVLLWSILSALGVPAQIDNTLGLSSGSSSLSSIGLSQILGVGVLLGLANVMSATVFGLVAATLYNLFARFNGGLLLGFTNV